MTLKDWLDNGWLKNQPTNRSEILDLLNKVNRDITESAKEEISLDWRLSIAYNACIGCATVALRARGYRIPGGSGKHYRTIQSLKFTIKPDTELIISLEAISKKRGIVNYDAAGTVTEGEVTEAIELAAELNSLLVNWLEKNYPEFIRQ